jgi:hypothetical protein
MPVSLISIIYSTIPSSEVRARTKCSPGPMPSTFRIPAECSNLWNVTTLTSSMSINSGKPIEFMSFQTVVSYRFHPFSTGFLDNPSIYYGFHTIKEHQSCLPSAALSRCQFDFLDANCPDGWIAFSTGIASSTITELCCPKYVKYINLRLSRCSFISIGRHKFRSSRSLQRNLASQISIVRGKPSRKQPS